MLYNTVCHSNVEKFDLGVEKLKNRTPEWPSWEMAITAVRTQNQAWQTKHSSSPAQYPPEKCFPTVSKNIENSFKIP